MRLHNGGAKARSESIQCVKKENLDGNDSEISFHKFGQDEEEKAVRRYETPRIGRELVIGTFWQRLESSYAFWISNQVC